MVESPRAFRCSSKQTTTPNLNPLSAESPPPELRTSDTMQGLQDFMEENYRAVAVAGIAVSAVSLAAVVYRRWKRERAPKLYPPDTVILHQIGRGPYAPSLSPFPVKLETFLRMARIPYENEHSFVPSSKGKYPWMEYNGKAVADSSFCIQYLNETLRIDLNKHLSPEQRAIARAFQKMTEENLYWCGAMFRWVFGSYDDQPVLRMSGISRFFKWQGGRMMRSYAWAHGIGRHSEEEIRQIAHDDMKALSDFIGKKKFLFGDNPCETDCAIFGMLSQICWHTDNTPIGEMMKTEFPNLVRYCHSMKEAFWPDWDACTTKGGTQEASR